MSPRCKEGRDKSHSLSHSHPVPNLKGIPISFIACRILGNLGRKLLASIGYLTCCIEFHTFLNMPNCRKRQNGSISDRALKKFKVTLSKVRNTKIKIWPKQEACTLDNPASRNFRKDTELWIVRGLPWSHRWPIGQPGPSEREVCKRGAKRKRRRGKRTISNKIGRCLLTRRLGKLPTRRGGAHLPTLGSQFTVQEYKVIAGRYMVRERPLSGIPEALGIWPSSSPVIG